MPATASTLAWYRDRAGLSMRTSLSAERPMRTSSSEKVDRPMRLSRRKMLISNIGSSPRGRSGFPGVTMKTGGPSESNDGDVTARPRGRKKEEEGKGTGKGKGKVGVTWS